DDDDVVARPRLGAAPGFGPVLMIAARIARQAEDRVAGSHRLSPAVLNQRGAPRHWTANSLISCGSARALAPEPPRRRAGSRARMAACIAPIKRRRLGPCPTCRRCAGDGIDYRFCDMILLILRPASAGCGPGRMVET